MKPETQTTKAQVREAINSIDQKLHPEMTGDDVRDTLSLTIKEDDVCKEIAFYCNLSST